VKRVKVIGCETISDELKKSAEIMGVEAEFVFLPHGLHKRPEEMRGEIQKEIDHSNTALIILGYGQCSNGVIGVKARNSPLVIPRTDDCIALLLGSRQRYREEFNAEPGTYYLTKGWIEHGDDPLKVHRRYLEKYDEQTMLWVTRETYKHYTRIALINTGTYEIKDYRAYAREVAELCGVRLEEIPGSLAMFKELFGREWKKEDFIVLSPGEELTLKMFLQEGEKLKRPGPGQFG